MVEYPYHERLHLQNFTAFSEAEFEFTPGLNVFVGENGTGKTHAMKAMYAWQMDRHLASSNSLGNASQVFMDTYRVNAITELQRSKSRAAIVAGRYGGIDWSVGLQGSHAADNGKRPKPSRPVFIPAIELMAHARNMNGILRDYADFDRTCFDFLSMVTANSISAPDPITAREIDSLAKLIPGEVEWLEEEQRFYLVSKDRRLSFQLVAEGIRKIAALHRLVRSRWIVPGTTLFWDEPEVNVNPKWMDELIEALMALTRSGVQVFLATHSYVILKEIDLAMRKSDSVRFFSFHLENRATKVMSSADFASLQPNAILDQYDSMLLRDMQKGYETVEPVKEQAT